ncbi:MAG: fluoride efflux transporter CrcB [Muribaculaceae bacterium]|nr:fluoride efflux transporter CrcB [Muribaculaceae bacterium]
MMNVLYVALGSAVGGACRYGVSQLVGRHFAGAFPLGTFLVNVVGCLLIGLLYGWLDRGMLPSPTARLLLITGFCGGFTTFSTFAHENYLLFGSAHGLPAVALYAGLSFAAGLVMVYFGHKLGGML